MKLKFLRFSKQDWLAIFWGLVVLYSASLIIFLITGQIDNNLKNTPNPGTSDFNFYATYGSNFTMLRISSTLSIVILNIITGWLVMKLAKKQAWYFPGIFMVLATLLAGFILMFDIFNFEFNVGISAFFILLYFPIQMFASFLHLPIAIVVAFPVALALLGGLIARHVSLKIK